MQFNVKSKMPIFLDTAYFKPNNLLDLNKNKRELLQLTQSE